MGSYTKLLESFTKESTVQALAGGALVIDLSFPESYRHTFAGIEYYSDAGDTPVVPGAGTETYLLETTTKPSSLQPFTGNVINSADESQVSWAANITSVRCTLAGITTATHAKIIVTGNIS